MDSDFEILIDDDDNFGLDFESEPPSEQESQSQSFESTTKLFDFEDFMMDIDASSDCNSITGSSSSSESTSSDSEMSIADSTPVVIHRIEDMVLSFLRQLAVPGGMDDGEEFEESEICPKDPLALTRAVCKIEMQLVDRNKTGVDGAKAVKCLRYPKKRRGGSAQPFAQLFRLLDIAHEATLTNVPTTKRDVYYKDVPLFKSQKVVDGLVDDLAATFELDRSDLNIRSSSKGFVCGSGLSITLLSGECICCTDSEGTLVPAGEDIETFSVDDDVSWVLVVEKEAVFQTLCRLQIAKHNLMPGPGIIITGKGYPDVATRHLVKSLCDALPRSVPVLALVDADPFGLDILSVYKYGSKRMQHENEKLAARRIKWIGIMASELEWFGIDRDYLLPITKSDEKKAMSLLLRENVPTPKKWRKELQYMLHSRHKAEIEILSNKQVENENVSNFNVQVSKERMETSFPGVTKDTWSCHWLLVRYLENKISEAVHSCQNSWKSMDL